MADAEIYADFYQDSAGRTRWRLVSLHAGDKDTLADSGQGYRHEEDAVRGFELTTNRKVWHSDGPEGSRVVASRPGPSSPEIEVRGL